MKINEYLKDRTLFLMVNIILFFVIASILIISKISTVIVFLIFVIWFVPILTYILLEFTKIKKYYDELENVCEGLDKKYLLSEVIKEPNFIEGKLMYDILQDTNRNMREHVNYHKNIQKEYREYIETWVHEIKTPIASTMLFIENNEDNIPIAMKYEIKKIEDYVEQVLYYSRSNDVSKDYIIKGFNLEEVTRRAIRKNSSDFINKRISLEVNDLSKNIYSDPKWVEFIISQLIGNAIKYSKKETPKVRITSIENNHNIILTIEDNGVGINERDINRVFDKGFTGENGRIFGKSTGIGLYLCKSLCNKLGLEINLYSKKNIGTKVELIFPIGNHILVK